VSIYINSMSNGNISMNKEVLFLVFFHRLLDLFVEEKVISRLL